ncbi:hypothetical protein HN911_00540 [Candidatus Bathyarchaeota archaeon]|jgi:hypothetical protein|nr:hypothetical protein [Candidatus Bathyarchaeota archaeon]MBT7914355.1 hypothetical protein [Candidatus Bathyarchaeota archaeon]
MNDEVIDVQTVEDFDRLTPKEKMIVYITHFRLDLYNRGLPCGPEAIQKKLREEDITAVPSTSTIARALRRQCLTNKRTGYYEGEYY